MGTTALEKGPRKKTNEREINISKQPDYKG